MTHESQVKVPVLVYKGDLSLRGRPALIQSDLQHLQLHVNKNMQKSGGVNDGEMTKEKKENNNKKKKRDLSDKCIQTVSRGQRCV